MILLGLGVCVVGILFSGFAGRSKERELTEEQKQASVSEFRYGRGVAVSILSGIMSACFRIWFIRGQANRRSSQARVLSRTAKSTSGKICQF